MSSRWPLLVVLCSLSSALAASPARAQQLDALSVELLAQQRWDEGEGRALAAARAGLVAQRGALPSRWQSVQVTAQLEAPAAGATWRGAEHIINALVTVQLGALPQRREALLDGELLVQRAEQGVARWRFVDEVRQRYHQWWYHAAIVAHLERALSERRAELEPLRQAAAQHHISALDLLDLEAQAAQLAAERSDAMHQRDLAHAQLIALMGEDYTLSAPELEAPAARAQRAEDPWEPLEAQLKRHPALRALEAQRSRAVAQAAMWEASAPWQLQLGPQARTIAGQETWVAAYLSVTIPLGNFYASDVIAARAQATALEAEARWEMTRLTSGLRAESKRWRSQREHAQRLEHDLLTTLTKRQALLEGAWRARQVPLERVLRGRIALHEAQHQQIAALVELHLTSARARALGRILSASETP